MIAYLKGEVIDLEINKIILLTKGGIGYEVGISEITYSNLNLNSDIELFIYHHITENNQSLFGFLKKEEKQIFEELIKISGIGGKVAIQILGLGINTLSNAIKTEDKKMIESIKGIGKKMAEKIILELKDKDFIKTTPHLTSPKGEEQIHNVEKDLKQDIINTLTNMGYQKSAIEIALTKISPDLESMEEIIPAVIREI